MVTDNPQREQNAGECNSDLSGYVLQEVYPGIRIGNAWLAKTERSEKLGTLPGSLVPA